MGKLKRIFNIAETVGPVYPGQVFGMIVPLVLPPLVGVGTMGSDLCGH